ncbi:MAG: SET domain-containing protein [Bacteroidetes bacterium]|nr:SET domain-containing protein [Bacteroidota bacterium]
MALKIKNSKLPNAGKGLFTDKPIKKNSKIIEYKGEIINWKEYEKRVLEHKDGYLLYINKQRCIDAYDTPKYKARYANDAEGLSRIKGLKNNAYYEISGKQAYIVAERDINAGEEVFVGYSKEYWDCIRYNIKHKLYKKN